MNVETPAGRGLEESAVAAGSDYKSTAEAFLSGRIDAHKMPLELYAIWSDGFRAGCTQRKVDRANADADYWYYVANNPAEARAEHARALKHFDVVQARQRATERSGVTGVHR